VKIHLRKILHAIAKIGPAVLRLAGVKGGTVADEAVKTAQKADEVLPPDSK